MDYRELRATARAARETAYAPYSGFRVGTALLCRDGAVYTGANIENSAFSPSVCAERVAFYKAVSDGQRGFAAIAVAGGRGDAEEPCPPCGVCRQVMAEFCGGDFTVIFTGEDGREEIRTLGELLPHRFAAEKPGV